MNKTIAYIAGPISTEPDHKQIFAKAAYTCRQKYKWDVINPMEFDSRLPDSITYNDKMNLGICLLSMCNTLVLLPGWENSKGAKMERAWAVAHGITVLDYDTENECVVIETEA